jgi:MFS family permease
MLKDVFLGRRLSHFQVSPFVKTFIVAETFLWASWNFIFPVLAIFIANKVAGGSVEVAGIAASIYYVGRIIFELIAGNFVGTLTERKKVLAIAGSIVVIGFAFIGFSLAQTVLAVYFFSGLFGAGLGFSAPARLALFSIHLDKDKEAMEWSVTDAVVLIGMALSAALGGFIAETYGFSVLFRTAAVVMWLSTLPYIVFLLGKNTDPHIHKH